MIFSKRVLASCAWSALGLVLAACGDSATSPQVASGYAVTALLNGAPFVVDGLNNAGQVVGRATIGGTIENVLITDGVTTNLGPCGPRGINAHGAVACAGGGVWRDGAIETASFPSGFSGSPAGVDDQGTTAGIGAYPADSDLARPCVLRSCAYVGTPTRVTIISLSANPVVEVPRIDNATDVIVFSWTGSAAPAAAIWQIDSTSQPYPCAGLPVNSSLRAVGGDNEVVGIAAQPGDSTKTDAFVCRNGVAQSLGSTTREANDISESGLIVGNTDDGHGFLWANGKLTVLDQGLAEAGWSIVSAERVNDAGQIVATASNGSGVTQTVLLTPK